MKLLKPDIMVKNLSYITVEMLKQYGIKGIILDVDNTLTTHGNPIPEEFALQWAKKMSQLGYKLLILSNNTKKRVKPFAKLFDIDFISLACKPLPFGYNRAKRKMRLKRREILVVGDQLFTDIKGAKFVKMKSALVEPISLDEIPSIQKRRIKERKLLQQIKNQQK